MRKLKRTVGVVKGRFQTYEPHAGHDSTIAYAQLRHDDLLIIVGTRWGSTTHDPMPFPLIKMMLESRYQGAVIIEDKSSRSSYKRRSEELTDLIRSVFPSQEAVIYGARDSIVHTYKGPIKVVETPTLARGYNATEQRERIEYEDSVTFRKGYIKAINDRPRVFYPAIDVAILDPNAFSVLMIGLEEEAPKLRFPGVFFDPGLDETYESAAERCIVKETPGILTGSPVPMQSIKVPDRRYRQTKDGVVTQLMRVHYESGEPRPGVGIRTVRWVDCDKVGYVVTEDHKPVYRKLKELNWY